MILWWMDKASTPPHPIFYQYYNNRRICIPKVAQFTSNASHHSWGFLDCIFGRLWGLLESAAKDINLIKSKTIYIIGLNDENLGKKVLGSYMMLQLFFKLYLYTNSILWQKC